jgi:hypothetical protein
VKVLIDKLHYLSEKYNLSLQIQQKGFKKPLSVTVDPKTVETLDSLRGEIPRSRYVEKALRQRFERETAGAKTEASRVADNNNN